MDSQPLFSIIVPVYNVANCIDRCLDSIVHQTYADFEVLIVDDCSTDTSLQTSKTFVSQIEPPLQSKFHILEKEHNSGLSATRNFGLRQAKGRYVIFIDSDDWVGAEYLSEAARIIQECGADFIHFNKFYYVKENATSDNVVGGAPHDFEGILDKSNMRYLFEPLFVNSWLNISKKELFDNNYFIEGCVHEDELHTPHLFLNAKKIYISAKPFYYYWQREASIMHSVSDQVFPYIKELGNIYDIWKPKADQFPIDYFYQQYYSSINSQFYGAIFWARDETQSLNVFKHWAKDIRVDILKKSFSTHKALAARLLFLKYFPLQFRSFYKKILEKKYK